MRDTDPSLAATGAKQDQALELPEVFGRYRIARRLGQGGMGAVFLARDTELDREVALKVPHFTAENKEIIERFYREARAAAGLSHPNICPIYDVGQIGGKVYLTMGYVEGKPLTEFIRPGKPLDQGQAAALVRKIALALEVAHRKGIIHRDLKPANIMINLRKEPVIMDFGLARRTDSDEARITRSGAIVGTPAYMSPEQVSGKDAGPASDIFSLGVILYEMLTAKLPFEGSMMAVLAQILSQEPDSPTKHRPDLQPDLDAVCQKAMAKKPADRFASMAEFAAALGNCMRAVDPASTTSAVSKVSVAPAQRTSVAGTKPAAAASTAAMPSPGRRRWWPWIAGAAGAAALLVWLGVTLYLNTGEATVVIELSDDPADVVVTLNGEVIDILGLAAPIKVKVGMQELVVQGPDYETVTKSFRLRRGGHEVVRVELKPNETMVVGPAPAAGAGHGLKCELYDGVNFDRLVGERVDPMVQWLWGTGAPDLKLPRNHFSMRWTGWLKPRQPGRYQIMVGKNGGGARLWLGEKLLFSQWRETPDRGEATVELDGSPQPLKVEFFKAAAKGANISLRWAPEGELEQPIPAEALFLDKAAALAAKPAPVRDKGFTMTVFTKTRLWKGSGISDRTKIGVMLNQDKMLVHVPLGGQRMFQPGVAAHFVDLRCDYPLADVREVMLFVNGTDAWGCESVAFQFFQGARKSRVYRFDVNQAFSAEKRDKLKRSRTWTLEPPPVWEDLPGMAARPSGVGPSALAIHGK